MDSKFIFLLSFISTLLFSQKTKKELFVNPNVTITYDSLKSSGIGIASTGSLKAYASFVEGYIGEEHPKYFHSIKFKGGNFSKKAVDIYLCIYQNKNGLPGKIIEDGKILIDVPPNKNIITVDLSAINIIVPQNGYFVGFEWIFKRNNKMEVSPSNPAPYNPVISGFEHLDMNLYSYYGRWKKEHPSYRVKGLELEISYLKN